MTRSARSGQELPGVASRRPTRFRGMAWAQSLARVLARRGVSPNALSLSGVASSAAGAALLALRLPRGLGGGCMALAGACVLSRLLFGLLDGMVALEGGRALPDGPLFNEAPERLSDCLLLAAAGWSVGAPWGPGLGWLAALLAVGTAYARLLGVSFGFPPDFGGPMAKTQRMAVLAAACLAASVLDGPAARGRLLGWALGAIAAGSAWTLASRLSRLRRRLLDAAP